MKKQKILFVCIHNSARSQMAEAWLKHFCGATFKVQSAGIEPGKLNPLAVAVMQEAGIDISQKKTQSVHDLLKNGQIFDYVITVCDETSAERCPVFPNTRKRLHWGFPDPSQATGTREERLIEVRKIRDTIKYRVKQWCDEICGSHCG